MTLMNDEEIALIEDTNSNEIINSTLDITDKSVLIINNHSSEKLDKLITKALDKKLKKIITSENCSISNKKIIKVKNYEHIFNEAMIKICPNYHNKNFYGITGTNGKTTTGFYLNQLMSNRSLFVGTTEEHIFEKITNEKHLTTPKLFNILKLLGLKENNDIQDVVIEVSSHALDQDRLKGLKFKVSGFTNLSQDHFDYHKNIENYFNAKLKLFSNDISEKLVYIDSKWGNKISALTNIPSFSIGVNKNNNLYIKNIHIGKERYDLNFEIEGKNYEISVPLSGPESHWNYLLALSMAYFSQIYNLDTLLEATTSLENPIGRFEVIKYKNNNDVIIDFAHTPESITQVIDHVRTKYHKVIVIFGAGGNRDKDKRPLMGMAVNSADKVIITNDNPRDEDDEEIAKSILEGIELNKDSEVILDRKEAIIEGINNLDQDSVLLILGKGHEKIQEFQDSSIEFSDQEIVTEFIKENS
ncbi:MAG: Mur ligase family protein [Candidatus Actinomarina sp.]